MNPAETSSVQPDHEVPAGALEVIERETAVLMRHLELLRRRTDSYRELDRAEYLMLRTLAETGPVDINSLACALGVDPSTAGRQVAVMQEAGLVERAPSESDRRRSIVAMTGEGTCRMDTVRHRRLDNAADLLADWPESELRTLGAMFTRYNKAVAKRYLTGDVWE